MPRPSLLRQSHSLRALGPDKKRFLDFCNSEHNFWLMHVVLGAILHIKNLKYDVSFHSSLFYEDDALELD